MSTEDILREIGNLANKHKDDVVSTFGVDYFLAFSDIAKHIEEQSNEILSLKHELRNSIKPDFCLGETAYINAHGYTEKVTVTGIHIDYKTTLYSFSPEVVGISVFKKEEDAVCKLRKSNPWNVANNG